MSENNGPPANGTNSPGDRLSRLSQASLRINESLQLDAALQAATDGARSLTDATYASIITLDGAAGWRITTGCSGGCGARASRGTGGCCAST